MNMFFFTQIDQSPTPERSRTISKLFPQDRNIKFGWKALFVHIVVYNCTDTRMY